MTENPAGEAIMSDQIVDPRMLREALHEYFTTPEEMRGGVTTLPKLAKHLGVEHQDLLAVLRSQPDVANDVLQAVALAGSIQIPRVLHKLMEAVEAGSLKAAEIYLEFIRKTIQDERLMKMQTRSTERLADALGSVSDQVDRLLGAARAGTAPEARAALNSRSPVDRSPAGFSARARVAIEADRSVPKATDVEMQDSVLPE